MCRFYNNTCLADIFAIQDVRTDKRIDFVGGIRGPEELERLVDSGEWTLAFFHVSNANGRSFGSSRCGRNHAAKINLV